MKVTVSDTETTGFDHQCNSVVEIAGVDLATGEFSHSLVKPNHPISFGAMATHMITEAMVEDALPLVLTDTHADLCVSDVIVFHNAEFDREFARVPVDTARYLCTYRCALHLFPDAESHRNMSLAYELGLDFSDAPDQGAASMPHRALFDAWVTRKLLIHMLEFVSENVFTEQELLDGAVGDDDAVNYLVDLGTKPVLLPTLKFGKHSGQPCSDIPASYWFWIEGQDFDMDIKHTADHWLRQRGRRR